MEMRAKTWILIAVTWLAPGCSEQGKSEAFAKAKGKTMQDRLEETVSSYRDIYLSPTSERITELELRLADLEWDGLFLAAPDSMEISGPGIPILALSGSTSLRAWEVDPRKNSSVLVANLDLGTMRTSALHKPPIKTMKPKTKGTRPSSGSDSRRYGCVRHVVGESLPNGLPAGTYAIVLISWDRLSNIRWVRKGATPMLANPAEFIPWPWQRWADSRAFKASPDSPGIGEEGGLALKLDGVGGALRGSFSIKARPIHLIPAEAAGRMDTSIHAAVNVDLFLYTLDIPSPEQARVEVPIFSSAPIGVGDSMQGWFTVPFPFEPSGEVRMLYAVADGKVAGPIRIPGNKP